MTSRNMSNQSDNGVTVRTRKQRVVRRRSPRSLLAGCLVGAVVLGACSGGDADGGASSFSDVSVDQGDDGDARSELAAQLRQEGLTSLASALDVVDVALLIDVPEFTLLAPSDEAFQAMDPDEMADLLANPANLLDVLRNHVVDEQFSSEDLIAMSSVRTIAGTDLTVSESDGVVTISGADVSPTDLPVDNGTVHVVDRIFVP